MAEGSIKLVEASNVTIFLKWRGFVRTIVDCQRFCSIHCK